MIKLKDGTTIVDNHEQDCCENVYADWSASLYVYRQRGRWNIRHKKIQLYVKER